MDVGITLTAFGAMLAGFYSIARLMLNQATKDRDSDRLERQNLALAIKQMAKSSQNVAAATSRSADEARDRNGHLAELIAQSVKNTQANIEKAHASTIEAMRNVNEQHIDHMSIDKAVIKKAK